MNEATENSIAMGMRIQKTRKAAKLTQMQFAEKVGVSTQYISDLERGVVGCSVPTLIKICDTLEVSSDYILKGYNPVCCNSFKLYDKFSNLSDQQQELMEEGFHLLSRAFSLK